MPAGLPPSVARSPPAVCVHRKGATRAFPAGSPDIPADHRAAGQAVFIPGVERVVDFVVRAGLARRVAKLRPIGVVKG